jgi:uncharacterized protein (UPF0548 family)
MAVTHSAMFSFRKPSDEQIREYLTRQADQPFSYDCVGCTRENPQPRPGWNIDHARVLLGHGETAFQDARGAIKTWQMFPREVASICWADRRQHAPREEIHHAEPTRKAGTPAYGVPRESLLAAVVYWAAPVRLWMVFPTRVVYVLTSAIHRDGRQIEQYGFGYGTLPDHPERGEERFLVEWDRRDDSVWYDLTAFSRPGHWLARVGYPYTRYEQARFRRLSCAAMQRAVSA